MITNGFDITQVLGALRTRIGWQQPTLTGSPIISDDNKQSDSGRTFQQFHSMVTIKNIQDCMEDDNMDDATFNAALATMKDGVIQSALNAVFNRPQQLESTLIYDRLRRNDNLTQKNGMFCGYRLWVAPGNYAAQVSQVSFLLSGDADFKLYLFQDAIAEPIYSQDVSVIGYSESVIELDEWILRYIDKTKKVQGGVFFIGYFQNDLPSGVVAIDEFVSQWNPSRVFGYSAFEAPQTVSVDSPDFLRIAVPYTYRTYGMNLEIQTYRDYTNFVLKNKSLFDELMGLSMAVMSLALMSYSTRTNLIQRFTSAIAEKIYNEINSNGSGMTTPYVAGLRKQIQREIERVQASVFFDPSKSNTITTNRPTEWDYTDNPMSRI